MNTGRWSWKYAVVKFFASIAFHLFYRKVHVYGRENIPEGGGLIFAANHQNALMDALAVLLTNKYQPVYLARADIFRNPLITRVLNFLKIIPVYRFRDGVGNMGQNDDTFTSTAAVLASGGSIGIMPEGNHGDKKRLRTLKKGIFRIAFRAVEIYGGDLDVKIIPVGLDFSNTSGVFEELAVNYGEPLSVSDYRELYETHPQKGINSMREDLAKSLSSLMVNIRDEHHYYRDYLLMDTGSAALRKQPGYRISGTNSNFLISMIFSQTMYEFFDENPEKAQKLRELADELFHLTEDCGISALALNDNTSHIPVYSFVKQVLCYPLFLAGFALHIFPYAVIRIALKKLKDPQFISSFKFTLGFLLIPLNYVLLALLFSTFLPVSITIPMIIVLPFIGYYAYRCRQSTRVLKEKLYFRRLCNSDSSRGRNISSLRSRIKEILAPVADRTQARLPEQTVHVN